MSSKEERQTQNEIGLVKAAALARLEGMSKREITKVLFNNSWRHRASVTEAVGILDSRFDIVQINGNSLKERGVYSGDYVLLQKDVAPQCGNAVIVEVNGRQYAKILKRADDGIELYSCGGGYSDHMYLPHGSYRIVGVVISYIKECKE